jgi:DNA mismatch repair protein MutS2
VATGGTGAASIGEDALARSLRVLEFAKVLAVVRSHARTAAGAERVAALTPASDVVEALERQGESREAEALLERVPHPDLGPVEDVRPLIDRAVRQASLTGMELRAIAALATAARQTGQALAAVDADRPLPRLLALTTGLTPLQDLEERIARSVTEAGEVADAASPLLERLRATARRLAAAVRERLEALVRGSAARYLQEPIVTIRQGRYVVPVRQEFRRQVPGLVHDTSASGQTLFVEPMAVLELGNELRRLEAQAREEAERVLRELSLAVAERAAALRADVAALAALDAVLARARYGREEGNVYPHIDERPRLVLRRARHPLLGPDAVPLDVEIGRTFRTLVVSGPNTGGKTVTLKTMGLMTAMALSGLAVSAGDGTEVGAFDRVLADIGDEQSIEQSLSTFSSHMSAIVRYLTLATERTLLLLDELGAGTDPTEGAALATAILEHLHDRGVRTVVTTHLSDLRRFAASHPAAENGSVAFDLATLRPTYRFELGVPGESNAFAIAARLGLDAAILEAARRHLTPEERRIEDLMASVAEMRRALASEEEAARVARREAEALRAELQAQSRTVRAEQARRLAEASERARDIVRRAKRESEAAIAALRAAQAGERAVQGAIDAARRALREALPQAETMSEAEADTGGAPLERVVVGQSVVLRRLGQSAVVVAEPDADGRVTVQAGVVRLRVDLGDLAAAPAGATPRVSALTRQAPVAGAAVRQTADGAQLRGAERASAELDVRGMRADEALAALDRWLDAALLAGLDEGRVIHGKGTGALRQAVAEALAGRPYVADFRLGHVGEGGDGVTVVRFAPPAGRAG